MKLKVKVLPEFIRAGVCKQTDCCPVYIAISHALAINNIELTPIVDQTSFSLIYIPVNNCSFPVVPHRKLPRSVCRFIAKFDQGKQCKPFNFILELPDVIKTYIDN